MESSDSRDRGASAASSSRTDGDRRRDQENRDDPASGRGEVGGGNSRDVHGRGDSGSGVGRSVSQHTGGGLNGDSLRVSPHGGPHGSGVGRSGSKRAGSELNGDGLRASSRDGGSGGAGYRGHHSQRERSRSPIRGGERNENGNASVGFGHVGGFANDNVQRNTSRGGFARSFRRGSGNSDIKALTICQLNDLIAKNRKLKETLDMERQVSRDLKKKNTDIIELLKVEAAGLKREINIRLGSKDYRDVVNLNAMKVLETMDESLVDVHDQIKNFEISDRDMIKLNLALLQQISPGAKLAFFKAVLAMESSGIRASISASLSKLVEADRTKDTFVKEVLDKDAGMNTPVAAMEPLVVDNPKAPTKKVKVVHDPCSVDMDVDRYRNEGNVGCRVVRVRDTCILANFADGSRNTKHRLMTDSKGGKVTKTCLACSKKFVVEETLISPATVVGPPTHGRIGKQVWVCTEHWKLSVATDAKDDLDCEVASINHEAQDFIDASPVIPSRARRHLKFTDGTSGTKAAKKGFAIEEEFEEAAVDNAEDVVVSDSE